MTERKKALRREIRQALKEAPIQYLTRTSREIARHVLALPAYRKAQTVFCFVGVREEIDTSLILADVLAQGKRLAVPLCLGKGIMEAREIKSRSELVPGSHFGIPEPSASCPPVPKEGIDFVVVPCLACDRKGLRLGQGGGYYDRYLLGGAFDTALLCRERFVLDEIPGEGHDLSFQVIVTENGVRKISG